MPASAVGARGRRGCLGRCGPAHRAFVAGCVRTRTQGFVRVINRSDVAGEVAVDAFDDTGRWFGPAILTVGPGAAVHFNSIDLERGNPAKGLLGGTGPGAGDWRLTLTTASDVEVLAYVWSPGGFLTAMNSVAPRRGRFHRAPTFNPASNRQQQSLLRLINTGAAAEVVVTGVDDSGESPGPRCDSPFPPAPPGPSGRRNWNPAAQAWTVRWETASASGA